MRRQARAHGGMATELARACAALCRGSDFFAARLWPGDADAAGAPPLTPEHRSKVIANGLRELDVFLNILIDEVSLGHSLPARPGQRNTANKLRNLRDALGLPHEDHERLLALGRSRECLFHCSGRVGRGDTRQAPALTLGWTKGEGAGRSLTQVPVGGTIVVSRADIESVCHFYRGLAEDLALPFGISP